MRTTVQVCAVTTRNSIVGGDNHITNTFILNSSCMLSCVFAISISSCAVSKCGQRHFARFSRSESRRNPLYTRGIYYGNIIYGMVARCVDSRCLIAERNSLHKHSTQLTDFTFHIPSAVLQCTYASNMMTDVQFIHILFVHF